MSDQSSDSDKVALILRQTGLNEDEAKSSLVLHGGDAMCVIREYITRGRDPVIANKKDESLNQQIYSNIRKYLDSHTKELQ